MIGAAFFAESIGLDKDPGWGWARMAVLFFGVLTIVLGVLLYFFIDKTQNTSRVIRSHLVQAIARARQFMLRYGYTFPAVFLVILIYVWFASSGSWTHWSPATRYYADLANGFAHGRLSLMTHPSSELLKLSNPYDPELRKGIAFPIDYSLFNGKFYIYWGPVPALILLILHPFVPWRVGDLFLAFGFISGIFMLQYLLLLTLWKRFFSRSPKWMLLLSILVAGLSGPWTYMLVNEPNGRIYEAAIAGAQLFLLGGLLVAARALVKSSWSYFSLALTGLLWGLSIGTRLVIAIPISCVCLLITYQLWRDGHPSFRDFAGKLVALALPLGLCLIAIGWYNWARFGSVTDTGMEYSLAARDMLKYREQLFSPLYVFQNLYNYTANKPAPMAHFPFLHSKRGAENVFPFLYSLPEMYETNPITGLFHIAPFTIFAVIPIKLVFRKVYQMTQSRTAEDDSSRSFDAINNLLLGTFFPAFLLLLVYFWAALRYMGDFLPALLTASAVGFWYGHQIIDSRPVIQRIYSALGIALAVAGITISILISLSANQYSFTGFM